MKKNHLLRMGTAAAMSALIILQGFSAVPSIQTYAEDEEIYY